MTCSVVMPVKGTVWPDKISLRVPLSRPGMGRQLAMCLKFLNIVLEIFEQFNAIFCPFQILQRENMYSIVYCWLAQIYEEGLKQQNSLGKQAIILN